MSMRQNSARYFPLQQRPHGNRAGMHAFSPAMLCAPGISLQLCPCRLSGCLANRAVKGHGARQLSLPGPYPLPEKYEKLSFCFARSVGVPFPHRAGIISPVHMNAPVQRAGRDSAPILLIARYFTGVYVHCDAVFRPARFPLEPVQGAGPARPALYSTTYISRATSLPAGAWVESTRTFTGALPKAISISSPSFTA